MSFQEYRNVPQAIARLIYLSRPNPKGRPSIDARDREAIKIVLKELQRLDIKIPEIKEEEAIARLIYLSRSNSKGRPIVDERDCKAIEIVLSELQRLGVMIPEVEEGSWFPKYQNVNKMTLENEAILLDKQARYKLAHGCHDAYLDMSRRALEKESNLCRGVRVILAYRLLNQMEKAKELEELTKKHYGNEAVEQEFKRQTGG
jgi:hypothetical protein